jgi:hypothetical protein
VTTAATYAEFAAREARDVSPSYERLSLAVSRDGELLALLGTLPLAKRTPLAWTRSHGQEIIWFGYTSKPPYTWLLAPGSEGVLAFPSVGIVWVMSVRWYSVVIDCHDVTAQSRWWAQVLDWRVGYQAADEVVVVPPHALDETRSIPVGERGPGLVFRART